MAIRSSQDPGTASAVGVGGPGRVGVRCPRGHPACLDSSPSQGCQVCLLRACRGLLQGAVRCRRRRSLEARPRAQQAVRGPPPLWPGHKQGGEQQPVWCPQSSGSPLAGVGGLAASCRAEASAGAWKAGELWPGRSHNPAVQTPHLSHRGPHLPGTGSPCLVGGRGMVPGTLGAVPTAGLCQVAGRLIQMEILRPELFLGRLCGGED